MKKLTVKGQERLFELLSHGFDIYNAFSPAGKGEKILLELRDDIQRRIAARDSPDTPISFTVPLELAGYMIAASKHLGDMCLAISKMDKTDVLFR